jgi:hypothetical protein
MSILRKINLIEIENILKYLPFTITNKINDIKDIKNIKLIKIFNIIKKFYDDNNIQPYKYNNNNKNIHRLKKSIIDDVVINEITLNTLFMYSIVGVELHKVTTYNKAIKLNIRGLNLFKIFTNDKRILNNKNIFDITCIDKHQKYIENFSLNRQILDDMRNVISTYRNENIFKIVIEDIVSKFNNNKYFPNITIEHKCECRSNVDNLTRNPKIKPHLAYHDSIISIYNTNFPDKKIEIILEYNEISHKFNSQDDLIRSKIGQINAWRYFVCNERIDPNDAKKYIKNKFIQEYYKLKIDSEKKEFVTNFCIKNNILQSKVKINELLDELTNKIDNTNINDDLTRDYIIESIFEGINISDEDLCEYKLNCYNDFFHNLIDDLYLGCCILEKSNISIVKYIIASSKNFSVLSDEDKREYLDATQNIIELYEKQLLNKRKTIDLEEVANLINVHIDKLIENLTHRNIPYKLDFIKNDETEYLCTNSLQNILNNINKNLYLDFNKSKNINDTLSSSEENKNQKLVYKNIIESKRLNKINEMFSDVIDYYCISANIIKDLMNKEINKISLLPDYIDYFTQFNPNVKINIYNYT